MVKVIFVRHGETEGNRKLFFQYPHTDLNDNGKLQANLVSQRIQAEFNLSTLYSSPFARAHQTALAISQERITVKLNDVLQERRFGFLEGKNYSYLKENGLDIFFSDQDVEGGESLLGFKNRCKKTVDFVKDVVKAHDSDGDIVVVSHGLTLGEIMRNLAKLSTQPEKKLPEALHFVNTSITVVNISYNAVSDTISCSFTDTFNCAKHLEKDTEVLKPKVHL